MESFSEKKQLARVAAGYKGGPMNKNPLTPQKMSIVEGWPMGTAQQLKAKQGMPGPSWNQRRGN